jgi:localization factor PodJL
MASTSPWSVKGIDPEAREAAKIAARKAGLTLGAWLNQTIRSAATEQLRNGGQSQMPPQPQPYPYGGMPPPPGAGQNYNPQPPAPTMQAIFESIQKLSSRIEAAEIKTTAAIAPLADQVDQLSAQLEEVKAGTDISTAPVERAVMRLSERLQKMEEAAPSPRRALRWGMFGSSR